MEREISKLRASVADLGERVHLEHDIIGHLGSRFERLAGSIMDETALGRRLERIENRMLGPDWSQPVHENLAGDRPYGGI